MHGSKIRITNVEKLGDNASPPYHVQHHNTLFVWASQGINSLMCTHATCWPDHEYTFYFVYCPRVNYVEIKVFLGTYHKEGVAGMYPGQSIKVGVCIVSNIKALFLIRDEIHYVDIVNTRCCDVDKTENWSFNQIEHSALSIPFAFETQSTKRYSRKGIWSWNPMHKHCRQSISQNHSCSSSCVLL